MATAEWANEAVSNFSDQRELQEIDLFPAEQLLKLMEEPKTPAYVATPFKKD